jgi:transposase-like protein
MAQERQCWRCKESIQFDKNGKMAGVGAGKFSFHHACYNCKNCHKSFSIAGGEGEKVRIIYCARSLIALCEHFGIP